MRDFFSKYTEKCVFSQKADYKKRKEQRMSCSFYMQINNNYLDSFENIKETTAKPPQIKHQPDQIAKSL